MENEYIVFKVDASLGNSLAVQWLGFLTSTAEGMGSIPSQGIKILKAIQPKKKKKVDLPQSTLN